MYVDASRNNDMKTKAEHFSQRCSQCDKIQSMSPSLLHLPFKGPFVIITI